MANLKKLLLGQRNPEKDTSFAKVIWPTDNKIQDLQTRAALTNEAVDLNNLPNLARAILISPYFDKISFANSSKLQVVAVSNPTGAKSFDLELENHSTLKDITLNGVHVKKLVVTNAPNLSPNKDGLKKAVLPGYDFTLGTAPLDGFSHLTQSDVTL